MTAMTYADAERRLLALPRWATGPAAYRPGLDRIRALLAGMGDPHRRYRVVHVAGTNGKGSTASLVAAAATASGLRTGLHTSPHLWHLSERMRLDGAPAPEAWIADAVGRHAALLDRIGPSFFEATVALSLFYFAEAEAEVAVVEVGLGGRLDATNAVTSVAGVVTSIGLEHTDLLGDTLGAIAREKAGIARPSVPLFVGPVADEARAAIDEVAGGLGARVHHVPDEVRLSAVAATDAGTRFDLSTPGRTYRALEVGLMGAHQVENACLAVRVAESVPGFTEAGLRAGLAGVQRLAGLGMRLERLGVAPLVVADVAHNADGLARALRAVAPHVAGRLHAVLGLMRDKDVDAVAAVLRELSVPVYCASLPSERALSADELAERLRAGGVEVRGTGEVARCLAAFRAEAGPDDGVLLAGSHLVPAALSTRMHAPGSGGGGAGDGVFG